MNAVPVHYGATVIEPDYYEMHLTALTVALLLSHQNWDLPQTRPKENGHWLCWSYSGKGNLALVIRESHPLSWFAQSLAEFDPEIDWRIKNENGWKR